MFGEDRKNAQRDEEDEAQPGGVISYGNTGGL